jgi:uncharacterized membrane protein
MNAMPKRYRWLLLLSLALNLGLASALVAHHWHGYERHGSGERRWSRLPDSRQLARVLGDADQRILREVLDSHREQIGGQFRPLGDARRDVAQALRAEPFDPQNLSLAFTRMRGSEGAMGEAMHDFMLDLATQVSADGRQRIAERMERGRRGRGAERGKAPEAADPPVQAEPQPQQSGPT